MKTFGMIHRSTFIALSATLCLWAAGHFSQVQAARAAHAPDAIWVHDSLYSTIGTDTSFKSPPPQSTDVIFSFADSGLMGQRSIAVYAPGDPEYNGGRWHVMAVTFTPAGKALFDDGNGNVNMELTSAEDLMDAVDMDLVTIADTPVRFECPLLPKPMKH